MSELAKEDLVDLLNELAQRGELIVFNPTPTGGVLLSGDDIDLVCINGSAVQVSLAPDRILPAVLNAKPRTDREGLLYLGSYLTAVNATLSTVENFGLEETKAIHRKLLADLLSRIGAVSNTAG
jgi:hypothetical protein